jgi:hypothetical protein
MNPRVELALLTVLSLYACGKSESPKVGDTPGSSAVKPVDKPADVRPVDLTDYESRATAMLDKKLAAYAAAGDCSKAASAVGSPCDCDKAAAAITTFRRDNAGELDALRTFEARHMTEKKQFTATHQEKVDAVAKSEDSLLVESCKDNKAMQDVLKATE